MKCNRLLLVVSMVLVVAFCVASASDQVVVEYSFERPDVQTVTIDGEMYDRVIMEGAPNGGNAGQPALPAQGASILLPFGTEVKSVTIIKGDRISLGMEYYIEPCGIPIRLSAERGEIVPPVPDEAIYNTDSDFPGSEFEEIGTHIFRGYSILNLKLMPVQYNPVSGELCYYPDLKVIVNTEETSITSALFRGFEKDEQELMTKVDNPELASTYWAAGMNGKGTYDLLIITTTSLASSFQPLKDYHDTTGIQTEIHTTSDIGSSDPDDIRDYITDRYLIDGIQYVIIGADDDIIPAKDLYVITSSGGYTEYNMPADIFFGCLDGTYNYDGDTYWGEPNDGEGGGDVDLIAEVYIGRAAVGTTTEADRFVNKTIWYLTNQHSQPQKVQLVGEHLGFGGDSEYAAQTLDELVDGSNAHGYITEGIPTDLYSVDRLYDRDWPGNDWPRSEVVTRINNGVHLLNHLGHGSPDYAMKMYDTHVMSDLTNTDLCLVYSQTCLAGHLDGTDCWAEYMNIKTDNGAFAVIMNARYGFGEYNSTDGPSQRFNREFWDAVFNTSEGKPEIGRANHDSKEDNLYRINESCMRWCTYELNLFGDPTVSVSGVTAIAFDYPNGVPETALPGQEIQVEVNVYGVGDGVPVPGTGQLHYSIDGGPVQSIPMYEVYDNNYLADLPGINCGEVLEYYFSAEESTNGVFYSPSPASPFSLIAITSETVAFEDDFETDKGWTISGGTWARGVPTGGGGQYGGPDPTNGYIGANVFGYNLNGDYENSMPERHLTSPVIDCSGMSGVKLKYWRWLGVEQPTYDHAYIRVSTNGSTWTTVWENTSEITDGSWTQIEMDISAIADDQPTVYIRWTMGTTDGGWRYCGWNIDGVEVSAWECDVVSPVISTQDIPDWTVDIPYSAQLEASGGTGSLTWSDKNGDLVGTGLSLSANGLVSGTPVSVGTVSFTALVVDDESESDEKTLSFEINPAPQVTTTALPDWTVGGEYTQQLTASGGTGTMSWVDKNGDLAGTGLSFSASGLISGTPAATGPINFTAVVTDEPGASGEKPFAFTINPELVISTDSLPDATVDAVYSEQLDAADGTGARTWSDKNNDLSGTGLTLSSTGLVSGTPTAAGTLTFTALVTDEGGGQDEKSFTFDVNLQLLITTESIPDWTVNCSYFQQMESVGGSGILNWSDKNGDLIGTGLSISVNGQLVGTPTSIGLITFIVKVTDDEEKTDEKELSMTVNPALEITTETVPDWTAGVSYTQQLETTGGTGEKIWSNPDANLVGTGLMLAESGQLSGIPAVAGPVSFTAHVVDDGGDLEDKLFSFTINAAVAITTETLPDGVAGTPYSQQLTCEGGTGAMTWADMNNDLDGSGLVLSAEGLLSGTPTEEMTVNFTSQVVDVVGSSDSKPFSFQIEAAWICADIDGNREGPDIADMIYLVNFMFNDGPPLPAPEAANFDGDIDITITDLITLTDYMFNNGPMPTCN